MLIKLTILPGDGIGPEVTEQAVSVLVTVAEAFDHELKLQRKLIGGAALTAYQRLQFEEIDSQERDRLQTALLKYCELDTLAMVMVWQAWTHL